VNSPSISAMSMIALPLSEPGFAICMPLADTLASTWPSTTTISQSLISTPLSLTLRPTISFAPLAGPVDPGASWTSWVVGAGGSVPALGDVVPRSLAKGCEAGVTPAVV
jgi:hypothetical protein